LGFVKGSGDAFFQPPVAREAEDVIDPALFAPGDQPIMGEAVIGAEHDPHPQPRLANVADISLNLLDAAGRRIDVRVPEFGGEPISAAEKVERQITGTVVVAAEEPALLMPVQRIVGGIEVENISRGGTACASRNRSTNNSSMASPSWPIPW
jgi:hypothetical protein